MQGQEKYLVFVSLLSIMFFRILKEYGSTFQGCSQSDIQTAG